MQAMARELSVAKNGGVYQLVREPYELQREAKAAGLAVFCIDIGHIHDKQAFIALLGSTLRFPDWAGKNWDALNDCLTDLAWLEATGYVLILEKAKHFAVAHKHDFDAAVEVLHVVADYWKGQGHPFWVLVHGAQGWDAGLAKWPGSQAALTPPGTPGRSGKRNDD